MLCVEEPGQSLVLGWVELPQVESPSLTREDPAEEHDLDYVDKFNLLVHQVLDAGLESGHLFRITPQQARLFPGCEPCGDARLEFGGRCPFRVTWLGDVEPPRLPPFDGSTKEPSSHVTLGILPAMAPPHSACRPPTTFGLTLKIFSHRPK